MTQSALRPVVFDLPTLPLFHDTTIYHLLHENPRPPADDEHCDAKEEVRKPPVHARGHHGPLGHTEDACDEVQRQEYDIDKRQVLEQDVHVVVDDGAASVHEAT